MGSPPRAGVDMHAHHVPAALLQLVQDRGGPHGFDARRDEQGRWLIQLPGTSSRIVPPPLVNDQRYLTQMETQNLSRRVLSGWNEVFGYEIEPDAGAWWCAAQNDALAEIASAHLSQLAGLASVPLQDPAGAASELVRAVEQRGLRGALIGTQVRGANLDAEELTPFWEAACAQGVPVIVHPGSASLDPRRLAQYFMANTVGNPTETTLAAAALIAGGVLERFPELQIVLVHGGGFLPYQLGRLQKAFLVRDEVPKGAEREPLELARRFHYDTILHQPAALGLLVEVVGADRLMFGTDFPFEMAEQRPPEEWLGPALPDEAELAAVSAGNATRLFGL
jgi:aminocarboxymuconate-semialdehyde decarboxylase